MSRPLLDALALAVERARDDRRVPRCATCGDVRHDFRCGRCGQDSEPADCPDRHGWEDHGLCCMGDCGACQHRLDQGENL